MERERERERERLREERDRLRLLQGGQSGRWVRPRVPPRGPSLRARPPAYLERERE